MGRIPGWKKSKTSLGYYRTGVYGSTHIEIVGINNSYTLYRSSIRYNGDGTRREINHYKTLINARKGMYMWLRAHPRG